MLQVSMAVAIAWDPLRGLPVPIREWPTEVITGQPLVEDLKSSRTCMTRTAASTPSHPEKRGPWPPGRPLMPQRWTGVFNRPSSRGVLGPPHLRVIHSSSCKRALDSSCKWCLVGTRRGWLGWKSAHSAHEVYLHKCDWLTAQLCTIWLWALNVLWHKTVL